MDDEFEEAKKAWEDLRDDVRFLIYASEELASKLDRYFRVGEAE